MIEAKELINEICKFYHTNEDNDTGCVVCGKWLSISTICQLIEMLAENGYVKE